MDKKYYATIVIVLVMILIAVFLSSNSLNPFSSQGHFTEGPGCSKTATMEKGLNFFSLACNGSVNFNCNEPARYYYFDGKDVIIKVKDQLESGKGYAIFLDSNCTVSFNGNYITPKHVFPFSKGLRFMGVPTDGMISSDCNLSCYKFDSDLQKTVPINNISEMKPGKAYFCFASADNTKNDCDYVQNNQPSSQQSSQDSQQKQKAPTNELDTCSDGTLPSSCSLTKPKFCDEAKNLANNCTRCGCLTGSICQSDGTCAVQNQPSQEPANQLPSQDKPDQNSQQSTQDLTIVPTQNCDSASIFSEAFVGFNVSRPTGWLINYVSGVILMQKDRIGTEGVAIYPVKPKTGTTLKTFMIAYLDVLKNLSDSSKAISYSNMTESSSTVGAIITGNIGSIAIKGNALAYEQDSQFIIQIYWSSASEFNAKKSQLKCFASSYKKTIGTPLIVLKGTYFQTIAPKTWKIDSESSNGISYVNADKTAGVMMGYVTSAAVSASDFGLDKLFDADKNNVMKTYNNLGGFYPSDFKDFLGRTWKTRIEEFNGTLKDTSSSPIHGVYTLSILQGATTWDLFFGQITYYDKISSLRSATPGAWDQNAVATIIIQDNSQIIRTSELSMAKALPKNNPYDSSTIMGSWDYKNQVDDRLSKLRQEAILGYESYHTAAGTSYNIPLNSIPPSGTISINEQTGDIWTSSLNQPPSGYTQLIQG